MRRFLLGIILLTALPLTSFAQVEKSEVLRPDDVGIKKFDISLKATSSKYAIFVLEEWENNKLQSTNEVISNDEINDRFLIISHSHLNPGSKSRCSVLTPFGSDSFPKCGPVLGSWGSGRAKLVVEVDTSEGEKRKKKYVLFTKLEDHSDVKQRVPALKEGHSNPEEGWTYNHITKGD